MKPRGTCGGSTFVVVWIEAVGHELIFKAYCEKPEKGHRKRHGHFINTEWPGHWTPRRPDDIKWEMALHNRCALRVVEAIERSGFPFDEQGYRIERQAIGFASQGVDVPLMKSHASIEPWNPDGTSCCCQCDCMRRRSESRLGPGLTMIPGSKYKWLSWLQYRWRTWIAQS